MPSINEVFDRPDSGIKLGNIPVAAPSPTVGTEGRVKINSASATSLKSVSSGLDDISDILDANAKAKAAARQAEAEDVTAKAALDTDFAFLKQSDDKIGQLADAYFDETGQPLSPDDRSALNNFAAKQEFFNKARAQGKGELALRIAQNRERYRILATHPHLTPEILSVAGKVQDLSKPGIDAALEDENYIRAKKNETVDAQRKELVSRGFQDVEQLSPEEVSANYNSKVAPELAALRGAADQVALANANTTLTQAQREKTIKKIRDENLPAIQRTILSNIIKAAQSASTPEEAAVNIRSASAGATSYLSQLTGLSADQVHQQYGYFIDPVDQLANDLASGKITKEFATNRLSIDRDNSEFNFRKNFQGAARAATVAKVLGDIMADQTKLNLYNAYGAGVEKFIRTGEAGTPFVAGDDPPPQMYGRLPADPSEKTPEGREAQQTIVKHAKDVNQVVLTTYDKPGLTDDDKAIATDMLINELTAPQSKNTEAAIYEVVPSLADKRFLEYRKTVQISPQAVARMDDHLSKSLNKIDELMNSPTGRNDPKTGQPLKMSTYLRPRIEGKNNDARLVIDFLPGSEALMGNATSRQINALVEHVNQSVRARAHLSGTDQYGRVYQVLGDLR